MDRPEATLSASADAQTSFRGLRAAWFAGNISDRRKLEPELRTFLARFPRDEQSDMVRVLIAFDCVSRGALQDARVFLASVREQVGAARDFARVGEAYALLREGKPEDAWTVLDPLAGKIVDPDQRLVYSELRLRVAVDAHRFQRAVLAAEELLAEAPPDARSALENMVRDLFQRAPKIDLLDSLQDLNRVQADDSAAEPAREWLKKMLRERLVELAVQKKDAALARQLLDTAPAALRASESGAKLATVASAGQSAPLIWGRSLGVVLSLGTAELRRRSASIAAGIARGLGLPDALAKPGSVHLISEEDGATPEGALEAMRELSAEGAAILVAGIDPNTTEAAARFADENEMPVLLIEKPNSGAALGEAFTVGESPTEEQAAIDAELTQRKLQRIARVGRAGESCDAPAESAAASRFSVDEWRRERVSAVLVLGSSACAGEVTRELHASGFLPELALGLEAAEFVYASAAPRQSFALGAGVFPSAKRPDAASNSALPALDWYEALGHDAALLSKAALEGFPDGRVDDIRAVRELHTRAERALVSARASLWTSDARGFSEAHVLPRTLTIVSSESQPQKSE
ncbi:MAG TPA: hypothetical protein VHV51_01740 [Polyangiaceae bacterium]|nr:hypothetical protein [Polyangiaceae bacterium]